MRITFSNFPFNLKGEWYGYSQKEIEELECVAAVTLGYQPFLFERHKRLTLNGMVQLFVTVLFGYHNRTVQFVDEPLFVGQFGGVLAYLYVVLVEHKQLYMLGVTLAT